MDQFCSLLCCWGRYSFDESKMDIITSLPLELAVMILRLLDPRALLAALSVNRKWLRIVRSDSLLRARVRAELRAQHLAEVKLRVGERCRAGVGALEQGRSLFSKKKSRNVGVEGKEDARRVRLVVQQPNVQRQQLPTNFVNLPIRGTAPALILRDARDVRAGSLKAINVESRRPQPYSLRHAGKSRTKAKTSNLRL